MGSNYYFREVFSYRHQNSVYILNMFLLVRIIISKCFIQNYNPELIRVVLVQDNISLHGKRLEYLAYLHFY